MIINQIGKNDVSIPTPDVDADSGNIAVGKVGYDRNGKIIGTVPVKVNQKVLSYNYSENGLQNIIGIGYFKGKYVVICNNNLDSATIATSKDGVIWKKQTTSGDIDKVYYVGDEGVILVNDSYTTYWDGKSFNIIRTHSSWMYVYGDGIFMEYNSNGIVNSINPSSLTISEATALSSNYTWKKICYGGCDGGVFVALPEKKNSATNNATAIVYYTLNKGVTWKYVSLSTYIYQDLCYGNGMFVLALYSTNANAEIINYYTSYNGTSWNIRRLPVKGFWNKIFYINGKFHLYGTTAATSITVGDKILASSSSEMKISLCSSDGINWELDSGRLSEDVSMVCDAVDSYIAVFSDNYIVSTMKDGDIDRNDVAAYSMQLPDPDTSSDYLLLSTEDNEKLYLKNTVGSSTSVSSEIQSLANTDTVSYVFSNIFYGNGIFILLPLWKATYGSSDTTYANISNAHEYSAGCYGNGVYVAIGFCSDSSSGEISPTNAATYSLTGVSSWTSSALPASQYWTDVCYGNGMFVAVANGVSDSSDADICAAISYTGKTWTKVAKNAKTNVDLKFNYICYGNGKFVAIRSNACCYSNDGTEWCVSSLSATSLSRIAFGNGIFAIITTNARVYYSTNLYDWEYVDTGAMINSRTKANNIIFGNGKFVAGDKYSYDCKTWKDYSGMIISNVSNSHSSSISDQYPVCYGNGRFVKLGYYCIDKTDVSDHVSLAGGLVTG